MSHCECEILPTDIGLKSFGDRSSEVFVTLTWLTKPMRTQELSVVACVRPSLTRHCGL